MSTIDRRRHERFRAALQVRYGTISCDYTGPVDNISISGMCIRTNEVFPAGTRIKLQIQFPERTIYLTGEVMWAIKVPEQDMHTMMCGMGIQFIEPGAEWVEFFADWKQELAAE
jgi:Tfp pilus assembly protein PilZ